MRAPTAPEKAGRRCSALGRVTWNVKPGLAVGTSTSPLPYQPKRCSTPSFSSAMNPSRDIDISAMTVMPVGRCGSAILDMAAETSFEQFPVGAPEQPQAGHATVGEDVHPHVRGDPAGTNPEAVPGVGQQRRDRQ